MRQSREFVARRRDSIASLLRKRGRASVAELAETYGISQLTVRRDLDYLEEQGIIVRKYGEAILSPTGLGDAESRRERAKAQIALAAARLVKDGESLFVNTSSTALMALERLQARRLTVVTNSMRAESLSLPTDATILVTGGEVRAPRGVLSGEFALNNIRSMSATTCFVGCAGISADAGVTSGTLQEATVNALMLERSERRVLLADSTKLGAEMGFRYADLTSIDLLVTDTDAREEQLRALHAAGVRQVLRVNPDEPEA